MQGMRSRGSKPDAFGGERLRRTSGRAGDAGKGQAVYAAACARCHGATRSSPGQAGSILDGSFLALINEQTMRTTIIAGRPDIGQPDWRNHIPRPPLTDAEITDVSAWLMAQKPAHPGTALPADAEHSTHNRAPGEEQPLAEKNDHSPSNKRSETQHGPQQ